MSRGIDWKLCLCEWRKSQRHAITRTITSVTINLHNLSFRETKPAFEFPEAETRFTASDYCFFALSVVSKWWHEDGFAIKVVPLHLEKKVLPKVSHLAVRNIRIKTQTSIAQKVNMLARILFRMSLVNITNIKPKVRVFHLATSIFFDRPMYVYCSQLKLCSN